MQSQVERGPETYKKAGKVTFLGCALLNEERTQGWVTSQVSGKPWLPGQQAIDAVSFPGSSEVGATIQKHQERRGGSLEYLHNGQPQRTVAWLCTGCQPGDQRGYHNRYVLICNWATAVPLLIGL